MLLVDKKYRAGAEKHKDDRNSENLDDVDKSYLIDEAIDEAIDMVVYLLTLRKKI